MEEKHEKVKRKRAICIQTPPFHFFRIKMLPKCLVYHFYPFGFLFLLRNVSV
jgi:hypothetical protein